MIYALDKAKYEKTGETVRLNDISGKDSLIIGTRTNINANRFYQTGKSADPKYYGGITNTFNSKGFDFSFLIAFSGGNYILDYDRQLAAVPNETRMVLKELYDNSWKNIGDVAKYPQLVARQTYKINGVPNSDFGDTDSTALIAAELGKSSEKAELLNCAQIVKNSKTSFGFKVVSLPNGEYLPAKMYDVNGYVSQANREKDMSDGRYFKGGSYFLYDNLFLIDAYLHGVKEAEDELIERVSLDFKIGATTYECLNTKTGEPWKPNMGWNVAVYAIWRKLADEGKACNRPFETVDKIVTK